MIAGRPMQLERGARFLERAHQPALGRSRPIRSIASRNSRRSSALAIALSVAPISSTPWRFNAPFFASAIAVLSAVCPPMVGSSASGFSAAMMRSTISGVIGSI